MFLLSKIFNFLAHPGVWIGFLLFLGTALLWSRWHRAGRWILTATMAFVAVLTALPVGLLMIQSLEDRFPIVKSLSGPVHGIVVLGGSVNQLTTKFRGQPSLTGAAERMTEFVALAKKYPKARLAFSAGSGLVFGQEVKETDVARQFFAQMGLDTTRIIFEDQSRNTYENAVYSYKLLRPKPGENWVLVTSASHMPRSVGAFRKAGWDPIPFPVDFTTFGPDQMQVGINMVVRLSQFGIGLRAWSALLVYRLLDRTDALFPAPNTLNEAR